MRARVVALLFKKILFETFIKSTKKLDRFFKNLRWLWPSYVDHYNLFSNDLLFVWYTIVAGSTDGVSLQW